jgi:transposase
LPIQAIPGENHRHDFMEDHIMPELLVTDDLWAVVEPLLPTHAASPQGGHPRVPDRVCLTGVLFVLKTGIPWEDFPQEMGCCGMTLWNRLHEWQENGVWDKMHRVILGKLRKEDRIDFTRVVVDSSSVRAVHGGEKTGPSPVDRRKKGSKHHLATDASGTPVATTLTGANRNDVTQLVPLVDKIPPIGGKVGAPLQKPEAAMADRGYDSDPHRQELSSRGIIPQIARRRTAHGSGLGIYRYVVEQTIALMHQFRRLRVRYDKRDDIHEAFMTIAEAIICWRRLRSSTG